jgi:hypothetical protein
MWTSENLDAIEGGGWGVFIASNHFLVVGYFCCRWTHRTVWWYIGQVLFTIRCVPRQHARWGLERSTVGTPCPVAAPDSPVRSDFASWHLICTVHFCSRPLSAGYRCPIGSPDSPVNYSGATLGKTRQWHVRLVLGLGHQTMSGAPLRSTLLSLYSKLCWVSNLMSFLVYVEPYASEI